MTQVELSMNYGVEATVAAVVMIAFVLNSVLSIKARHCDGALWHVHLGAANYGALFGAVIGFVIVPLRVYLTNASLPPQYAAVSGFSVLAIMIALRRGLIGRLPFLGPQVKAYRRALLRKTIETSQKQLDKLTPKPAAAE
ncbi:MAG: hypothetical protein GC153_12050 [Alphaproteobacteria bacterium]|nr:hypothetical protein [Alphaproteobacteria bacterium]